MILQLIMELTVFSMFLVLCIFGQTTEVSKVLLTHFMLYGKVIIYLLIFTEMSDTQNRFSVSVIFKEIYSK